MLIYFHGNSAFSFPNFMTYGASLWDTIREAVKKSPTYCPRSPIRQGTSETSCIRNVPFNLGNVQYQQFPG
uniref:Uncharacterized protein n=1 Tax=Candidatus Kentrum sp. FM TaxID=2126340 RepID=A0A450WEF3_9GAMM|nr:MAG: hypothetical protein BECKFM1743A_GA0114220_103644 [Candidatus Kentron sp. FM]VFJ65959.1 MAG: hypothetical protein BECKFM1743C_GA0114222_104074 [Candidatus Kentron sp. FM]VFK15395.1 MAG: hypothetical protein BECKFM1743B_GA0114221_103684 [Candidatus Kentron sp. FM]